MNVLIYSKTKDLSELLQSSLNNTDYKVFHAGDIGVLHLQFFSLDSVDLLIICNDVIHSKLETALSNMKHHSRFFPVLCIDLENPASWNYKNLFTSLISLPPEIPEFSDKNFLKCLENALNRTYNKVKFSTTEQEIVNLLFEKEMVSLEEISYKLWNEFNDKHKKTIYAYIHNIRNRINDDLRNPHKLIRLKNGNYQLKL